MSKRYGLLLALLISGCASPDASPDLAPTSDVPSTCDPPCAATVQQVEAPILEPGTTWHYRSKFFYDVATFQNVTVAKRLGDGYLFAGTSKEDLVGEAVWGRFWYGPHAANLSDVEQQSQLLSFPLYDGKTWQFSPERLGRPERIATARAMIVRTPAGTEEGFAIDVRAEQYEFHAEYAPTVGYFTRVESRWADAQMDRLELVSVSRSTDWRWFEKGPGTGLDAAGSPKTASVSPGFDAVLVSAGSSEGGHAFAVPPPGGTPWTYDGKGREAWGSAILPATPGTWTFALTDAQDCKGCSFLRAVPVKWISP